MAARRARAEGLVVPELDHVLIAVAELESAGDALEAEHGLASVAGGRHPAWGTANRIVPLGDAYLELIAVVDPATADQSAFGRWVGAARPGSLLGWAVRTDRIAEIAARLQLTVTPGSREGRDGRLLEWQLAGVDKAIAEPPLPFFIEWGADTSLPGRAEVEHPAGRVAIAELVLEADAARIDDWLGPHAMPLTVRPGAGAVRELRLRSDTGEVALG